MLKEIITVINPTARLTLTPTISLLKISLPNLSVPSQNVFVVIILSAASIDLPHATSIILLLANGVAAFEKK